MSGGITPPAGGRRPRRSLGQNFLKDQRIAARIARACKLDPGSTALEVGPGRGALTRHLIGRCARLVLLEKDAKLASDLSTRFTGLPEVEVVEGDAAEIDLSALLVGAEGAVAVGNLPYNAAAPILFNLLSVRSLLARAVLMFQKEVADRLSASPGDREYRALSLIVQSRMAVERLFDVPPDRFVPRPRVWSAVVRLAPLGSEIAPEDPGFDRLVHALHAQPRKTCRNSLASGLGVGSAESGLLLERAGIDPGARPCAVTPELAMALWEAFTDGTGSR